MRQFRLTAFACVAATVETVLQYSTERTRETVGLSTDHYFYYGTRKKLLRWVLFLVLAFDAVAFLSFCTTCYCANTGWKRSGPNPHNPPPIPTRPKSSGKRGSRAGSSPLRCGAAATNKGGGTAHTSFACWATPTWIGGCGTTGLELTPFGRTRRSIRHWAPCAVIFGATAFSTDTVACTWTWIPPSTRRPSPPTPSTWPLKCRCTSGSDLAHRWEKSWPCEKIWGSFPERAGQQYLFHAVVARLPHARTRRFGRSHSVNDGRHTPVARRQHDAAVYYV